MDFLDKARDKVVGGLVGLQEGGNSLRIVADRAEEAELMHETGGLPESGASDPLVGKFKKVFEGAFAELELAFEDTGWRGMGGDQGYFNFNRSTLRRITALSRVMYLINPLIKRAVTVQELYVWGRGCKIKAKSPEVQEVLDDFFKHPKNQRVIGNAWAEREREQRLDGNTFFVFYINKVNGACRIRLLPFDQIETIIYNPDDAKEPWFYARVWSGTMNAPGMSAVPDERPSEAGVDRMYYPDIDYNPRVKPKRHEDGTPIDWNTRVYHLKTGGLSMMRFGVPELFCAFNWATGYKKILENFATILAAYARMAMQITGLPGKKGVAAAKNKLNTGIQGGSRNLDNNPPSNAGSWWLSSGNADIKPVKTAGSTTGPDEARALRSMVAAGSDTPEHFFGDSDIGNFATSSTLDRPTELKMVSRQTMWVNIIERFSTFLIERSAVAPGGKLRKAGYTAEMDRDPFDGTVMITVASPADKSLQVSVEFPNILERDVTDRVRAVVQAVTLGGSTAEGIIPNRKQVARMLLEALAEPDSDNLVEELYPQPVTQGFIDPADMGEDARLAAKGKKELGDAALIAAKKPGPTKPAPASGAPAQGGRSK